MSWSGARPLFCCSSKLSARRSSVLKLKKSRRNEKTNTKANTLRGGEGFRRERGGFQSTKGEGGGGACSVKRARVAAPQSKEGGAVGESAKIKPDNRRVDISRKQPPPPPESGGGGGGFLGGLLGSLSSNAGGIASGKEHSFRQGLRGGEVCMYE